MANFYSNAATSVGIERLANAPRRLRCAHLALGTSSSQCPLVDVNSWSAAAPATHAHAASSAPGVDVMPLLAAEDAVLDHLELARLFRMDQILVDLLARQPLRRAPADARRHTAHVLRG